MSKTAKMFVLERSKTIIKPCPKCGKDMSVDVVRRPHQQILLIYECDNGCDLSFSEAHQFVEDKDASEIYHYKEYDPNV